MSVSTHGSSIRLSWVAFIAGLGVFTSVILNYAAYDTRITILERALIVDQKIVSDLQADVKALTEQLNTLRVSSASSVGNVNKTSGDVERVQRVVEQMERTVYDMEKRLRDLETKRRN